MSAIAHTANVPFSALVAVDEINARAATKEGLDELAASIEVKGIIQPLAVRLADRGVERGKERYQIIDGRRRFLALQRLVKWKVITRDHQVPVLIRDEDDAGALETSLMANTVRLPMHPVDQHSVMARLAEDGMTTADIAARFGIAQRTVQQHLALGRLAPEVRAAWKKGKIDAKTAQAFAVHPDPAVQADVLARLKGRVTEWDVRQQLSDKRERVDQSDELALIGEQAYLDAGGTITDDLFSDARYVDDVPLARKLARERLEAECKKLVKAGWAWAEVDAEEIGCKPSVVAWNCQHVNGDDGDEERAPEDYSKAEREQAGCLVGIGFDGKLEVRTGLIKPEAGDEQTDLEEAIDDADDPGELPGARAMINPPAAEAELAGPFEISQALTVSIHETLTVVAADVLRADPLAALQVLVAQLECVSSIGPVKIEDHGNAVVTDRHKRDHRKTFAKRLPQVRGADTAALLVTLAGRVAQALSMVPSGAGVYNATTEPGEVAALRDFLDGAAYLGAMRHRFDAADYFTRARKETALAALAEMVDAGVDGPVAVDGANLAKLKKSELAEFAAEHAKIAGWLPPELRHPAYTIGAQAPAPVKKKGGKR